MQQIFLTLFLFCLPIFCQALTYSLPPPGDSIVGDNISISASGSDNFNTIGHRYDVGYYELIEANPGVDPMNPGWASLTIPQRKILPPGPRTGIVINIAEMRLYYYVPHSNTVLVYPVGIGREGWATPICTTTIKAKEKYPTWNVPESIRKDRMRDGVILPKVVLPGPENPLGDHAMRLAVAGGTFLLHGTNDPDGIGRRSSSGCIRMLPKDIAHLFSLVPVGTQVRIMNAPVKVGWHRGQLYLESHVPLQETGFSYTPMVRLVSAEAKNRVNVDWNKCKRITDNQNGIPQPISGDHEQYVAHNNIAPQAIDFNDEDIVVTRKDATAKFTERDDTQLSELNHHEILSYDPDDNFIIDLDQS